MSDGSITISTELDNKTLERQLSRLSRKIESVQDRINQKQAERAPIAEQSKQIAARLDAEKATLEYMKSGDKFFSPFAIDQQEASVKALQKEWDAVQRRVERYDDAINRATIELNRNKEKAGAVEKQLGAASKWPSVMDGAWRRAEKSLGAFGMRLREVIRSALLFTVISQGLAMLREWLWATIQTNGEAVAAIARLKAALLTLAQPLVDVVIPAFTVFINILSAVIYQIARVISFITGGFLEQSKKSAQALHKQSAGLKKVGGSAKDAAKGMEKYLASFDDLNQIGSNSNSGSGTGGGGGDLGGISPDFSALGEFDTQEYKDKLDEITVYVCGALLALGAILTFSGANIPLGIALMAAGAIGLAAEISENWNAANGKVRKAVNTVLLTLGSALLVIGAILAFSGANLPLGIGLMLAGAVALGTAAKLNWNDLDQNVQTAINVILLSVGTFMLAIGAVFAFSGANIPLGIGLMIAGAISLAAAAALNWNKLPEEVQTIITAIFIIVSTALLVLGAVLAISGTNIPLGIALMAAGALGLATAAALNWDSLSKNVSKTTSIIAAIVGGALLALGAILAFSGANLPLGIGLMLAGAATLCADATLSWDKLSGEVQNAVTTIAIAVGAALLVLGSVLAFSGANIPLGIGLMAAGALGLATAAYLNWNKIKGDVKTTVTDITTTVGAALLAVGAILAFSGAAAPLGIGLMIAGGASLGTAAALNWDFILDKLKESWGRIKEWWNTDIEPKLTLSFWEEKFENISKGLKNRIKDAINGGVELFNRFIDWVNDKLNVSWDAVSIMGQEIIPAGSFQLFKIPHIPRLAQGAVIPPNREFLAVLGDQTTGTNIEAPLETIKQALHEVIAESGGTGEEITLRLVAGKGFVRDLDVELVKEHSRRGVKLVRGGALT